MKGSSLASQLKKWEGFFKYSAFGKCHGPINTVYFLLLSNTEKVRLTDLHPTYVECVAKDIVYERVIPSDIDLTSRELTW
jgi:hypothetical protein